jgi:hypothetical protein
VKLQKNGDGMSYVIMILLSHWFVLHVVYMGECSIKLIVLCRTCQFLTFWWLIIEHAFMGWEITSRCSRCSAGDMTS